MFVLNLNFNTFTLPVKRLRRPLSTCQQTFAGISSGQRLNAVRRVRNLISSVFNGDCVRAGRVGHIGDGVGAVPVVLDGGVLRFALRVLTTAKRVDMFAAID